MPPEGCFGFGEYNFRECETEGKFSKVNSVDMKRTEDTIKKALLECDSVIVSVHSHEIKHDTDDEPDDFLIEFCRRCIDAGASAVIGTGTHQLNALSTAGLSLTLNKSSKGNLQVEMGGHVSIKNQKTVPMEFYVSNAE